MGSGSNGILGLILCRVHRLVWVPDPKFLFRANMAPRLQASLINVLRSPYCSVGSSGRAAKHIFHVSVFGLFRLSFMEIFDVLTIDNSVNLVISVSA